ncbi:ankyrin [Parathielavia appendiculata]|uniref:Ankyrin n=1 Tax=Parathielavia appendiculata TaxID=2587402 RepID=A0AAN6TTB7_9PEZI|nr:ankyrin [Parathielavia appendiculata]
MYEEDSTTDTPPLGATSLHIVCVHHDLNMVKRLIASGYNRISRNSEGRNDAEGRLAPFTAMEHGHDFFAEYLVARGLKVELQTASYLETPLHFITNAPIVHRLAIVQFLCETGASKGTQNAHGSTIAPIVFQYGHPDSPNFLQYLILSEEWRLRIRDYLGRTPIHVTAISGHLSVIGMLGSVANAEILTITDQRDSLMAVD